MLFGARGRIRAALRKTHGHVGHAILTLKGKRFMADTVIRTAGKKPAFLLHLQAIRCSLDQCSH